MKSEIIQKQVQRWDPEAQQAVDVDGEFTEQLAVGTVIDLWDEHGKHHAGLVTAVHGPQCINAVYISDDPAKHDPYGRQIERLSSLQKRFEGVTAQNGRYYLHV